jgi:hypothetical protein
MCPGGPNLAGYVGRVVYYVFLVIIFMILMIRYGIICFLSDI